MHVKLVLRRPLIVSTHHQPTLLLTFEALRPLAPINPLAVRLDTDPVTLAVLPSALVNRPIGPLEDATHLEAKVPAT